MNLKGAAEVGLPPVTFLYTLDQVAGMLNIELDKLLDQYIYYHLRSVGLRARHQMIAVNIAPKGKPEWRVDMHEFIFWLRRMGFKIVPISDISLER